MCPSWTVMMRPLLGMLLSRRLSVDSQAATLF